MENSERSQAEWYTTLRDNFNLSTGQNRETQVPGFLNQAAFINVAEVGMKVFDLRKSRKDKKGN